MQTNTNPSGGAQPSDLLSTIYKVEVRNEQKISAADRAFCGRQQAACYGALERIEQNHAFLAAQVEQLHDGYEISYKPNGHIITRELRSPDDDIPFSYRIVARQLFSDIEAFAKLNHEVNEIFAARIVRYFNETYHVSVPTPNIDAESLKMGDRPVYMTYVDRVVEHLGGRSFRATATEEILDRFRNLVKPGRWATSKPELKSDKIVFPDLLYFDEPYLSMHSDSRLASGSCSRLNIFCEGICLGAEELLTGSLKDIPNFDSDRVDLKRWYELTSVENVWLRFYKNGRIDVRFKDAAAAETCFRRLCLHELRLHNDND